MNANKSLDEVIEGYYQEGLLAYKDLVYELADKVESLPEDFSLNEIKQNVALLAIWPLIEAYRIREKGIGKDLNRNDKAKLKSLSKKFEELKQHEDIEKVREYVFDSDFGSVRYLNPDELGRVDLINTVTGIDCAPLTNFLNQNKGSTERIYYDSLMGGSLYVVGEDAHVPRFSRTGFSFMTRDFVTMHKDGRPMLFMDTIEGGKDYFGELDHWRGKKDAYGRQDEIIENRVHQVYVALAATMSLADNLDIGTVVPRDFELVELSRNLGMRERRVFSNKQERWKAGLHSEDSTGVYTHTLFRGKKKNHDGRQLRHMVLKPFHYRNSSAMVDWLNNLGSIVVDHNSHRDRNIYPRTDQRLDALNAMYDVVDNFYFTTDRSLEEANKIMKKVYDSVKEFNRTPPDHIGEKLYH